MENKFRVGIVGASGYAGGELVRLLAQHPDIDLTYVTSGTYADQPLSAALPGVAKRVNLLFEKFDLGVAIDKCDVVFLAGEAGLAMEIAPHLIEAGMKAIDLSADFRLKDPDEYARWYKKQHTAPSWIDQSVYGLPELNLTAIQQADLVANPGCYPTSAILALAPLLRHKLVDPKSLIVDSHSGVSGGGRSMFGIDFHFSEVNESIKPYGVGGVHRHTPEIEQSLSEVAGEPITLSFTPHLAPITRGILTTTYANLATDAGDLHDLYRQFYAGAPFVVILEPGDYPATKHTFGTNYCYIGLTIDKRTNRVIVISALDNLVKGAAGQAIQNMNLMCGFEEMAGLTMSAVWP